MCLICQQRITQPLKCPLNAEGSRDTSEPYSPFLNSVSAFRVLGTLPVVLTSEKTGLSVNWLKTGVHGTNFAMSSSTKRNWRELRESEKGRMLQRAITLGRNSLGISY